jgi:hypothetical protein
MSRPADLGRVYGVLNTLVGADDCDRAIAKMRSEHEATMRRLRARNPELAARLEAEASK